MIVETVPPIMHMGKKQRNDVMKYVTEFNSLESWFLMFHLEPGALFKNLAFNTCLSYIIDNEKTCSTFAWTEMKLFVH